MNLTQIAFSAIGVLLLAIALVLPGRAFAGTGEGRGEHAREGGEKGKKESEESGTELAKNETYDKVRHGIRLILAFDSESGSFKGTVENTTTKTVKRVRVEVHLSSGRELGPTTPDDLAPGERQVVKLTAETTDFEKWSAHAEVGSREHGHGEGHGEHGREGAGEHGEGHK